MAGVPCGLRAAGPGRDFSLNVGGVDEDDDEDAEPNFHPGFYVDFIGFLFQTDYKHKGHWEFNQLSKTAKGNPMKWTTCWI